MEREESIAALAQYGITDEAVYLIDLIPLIEMIWADGKAQQGEIDILESFRKAHVKRINTVAGHDILSEEFSREFVERFLAQRPDPELLKTLRSFVAPTRLSSPDESVNEHVRDSILAALLEIASASVVEYPYGIDERFESTEKKCYFSIIDSLESKG